MKTILLFGAGFSAIAYAKLKAGDDVRFIGTTRSAEKHEALQRYGIEPITFDGTLTANLEKAIRQADEVVVSISPDEAGDPVLNCCADEIAKSKAGYIAYLSTVGVYGNHDGAWVDEETPPNPSSERSKQRVVAENAWLKFGADHDVPVSVLRLSGIYGPRRNQFMALKAGRARRIVKEGQVFNRIHVADIAGVLDLLGSQKLPGVWNVTDDLPAPAEKVVEYCASLMKVDPPEAIAFENATMTPMARSFYGESKRVSNAKIKNAGYQFKYPNYEQSFASMWEDGSWMDDN